MLEGKYGFFNLYQNGDYDRNILLKDLGSHFEGKNLSMKPYPCCRGAHAALDLTLQIVGEQDIDVDNIESITFKVTQRIYDLAGKPFKIGSNPQVDAQFSIPYTVATAILKKDISLRDFEDSIVTRSPALGLVEKIKVVVDENISEARAFVPVTINIAMKDGRIISRKTTTLKGSPESPMSLDECIDKFKKCNECSVDPLGKERVEDVIGLILDMEHMEDVGQLSRLLS
jgi:2-methylcitrate dehydratase PrpD